MEKNDIRGGLDGADLGPEARTLTRRRLLEVAALTGAGAMLAACGGSGSGGASTSSATTAAAATTGAASGGEGAPRQGGTFRVAFNTVGNDTLDPNDFSDEPTLLRAFQMYDRLYEPLPSETNLGGATEPMLAESAEPNGDWLEWKITIRPDVVFHDGSPLTVDDVIYSFQWALSPDNGFAGPAGVLVNIDVGGIRKDGERSLVVPFTQPYVYFLNGLCTAPSIVKAGTTDYAKPNGTGPFSFVSFTPNQQTVMARNANYWQPDRPYLDGVTMILFDDATSAMNALLGGQVDAIGALDPTIAKTHEQDGGLVLVQTPSSLASYFYVRVDKEPFTDPRVREAMKLAVDREQLVENILLGYGSVGNDVPGKGYADYDEALPQRTYDPERAAVLLKEAGHEGLKVTGLTYPDRAPEFVAFQQQAKAAGIEIELQTVPLAQYYAEPYWPNPPTGFAQTRWPGTFAYVAQNTLTGNAPYPETGWNDPEWDAAFATAISTVDEASRNEQMKALEKTIWEEGGLIGWGYANHLDMHSPAVQGLQVGPDRNLGFYNFRTVWLSA